MRFLIILALILLSACHPKQAPQKPTDLRIKVLATTAMVGSLVSEVGKERVQLTTLIRGEIDPHSYELVKGDDEKFSQATLVFYNGLGLEHGSSLRAKLGNHPHALAVGELIRSKKPEAILTKQGNIDPHVWMDISLWSEAVIPIADALSQIDPEGAPTYYANAEKLRAEMALVDKKILELFAEIPQERRYLVTSHDAFHYFTRRYLAPQGEVGWEKRSEAPEGLAPEGQLSCADIQGVIDHLYAYQIRTVFPESNVSKDSLKKITASCAQKGLTVTIAKKPLYADSMGEAGSGAETYLTMIEYDALLIAHEWNSLKD